MLSDPWVFPFIIQVRIKQRYHQQQAMKYMNDVWVGLWSCLHGPQGKRTFIISYMCHIVPIFMSGPCVWI